MEPDNSNPFVKTNFNRKVLSDKTNLLPFHDELNIKSMFSEINNCRICSNRHLVPVLSLGDQYLTGVFPKSIEEKITKGPLDLVWCRACGLLQLKQSYNLEEMYGDNYGYRSGLNKSMVNHLTLKIRSLERNVKLNENDLVIDIGSNDATSLKAYTKKLRKVGVDPTGLKFKEYYSRDIELIPDFFSSELIQNLFPGEKAKIITSIAMFYDLESPINFVKDIESLLAGDGIWHFEQSYMPSMLRSNSYDTICHEHLEFYSFKVIKNLLESGGLKVIDVQMNSVNGGSFAVTACKQNSKLTSNLPVINWMLQQEEDLALHTLHPYQNFEDRVHHHKKNLVDFIHALLSDGKKILGYGASTKGNVLLQFCGLTSKEIPYIADVNEKKYGCYTPGTGIPIISEADAREMKPDYFLVLPWHFKHSILEREQSYMEAGGKFIFPLPEIEVI